MFYITIFGDSFIDSTYWMNSTNSSALGLAVTAQTNHPDAVFFNPAALTTNKKSSLNINYTAFYNTDFSTISFISRIKNIHLGIGTHISQTEPIEKTVFDSNNNTIISNGSYNYSYYNFYLSSAMQLPYLSFASIGASYNLHQMEMDNDTLHGQTANLGFHLQPLSFLSLGYNKYYVIPFKLTWVSQDKIDNKYLATIHSISAYNVAGLELKLLPFTNLDITLFSDYVLNKKTDKQSAFRLGSKFSIKNVDIKAGYNHRFIAFGVSTKIINLKFNYALILPNNDSSLDNRHSIGFNYLFK